MESPLAAPTATVIGAFQKWECSAREAQLAPQDVLAIFSAGITEAAHGDEEFGEARLIGELQARRDLAVSEIVTAVLAGVQQFSAGAQSDDLTLVILRGRS